LREYITVFAGIGGRGAEERGLTDLVTGSRERPFGINYAGYLKAGFGLGTAARGYVEALRNIGYEVLEIDAGELLPGGGHRRGTLSSDLADGRRLHRVNIVHINPDLLFTFRNRTGAGFFRDRYTIGIWAWETPVFPDRWHDRFSLVDEVWTGGSYMARGISVASPVPVLVVPHAVKACGSPDRERFGLDPGEFIFLYSFDFNSTYTRKNPLAALEAFRKAFSPDDPARLVMKSLHGSENPAHMKALETAAEGLRVTFMDRSMSSGDNSDLTASCDVFVSLHRAEGFGLGIAEAMALGKPVIATGYSGNMDFMNVGNSLPVRFRLEELRETDPPYEKGSLWATPDTEDAAGKMRLLFSDRELALRLGNSAGEHMARFFSPEAVGGILDRRLRGIIPERGGKSIRRNWLWSVEYAGNKALRKAGAVLLKFLPGGMVRVRRAACRIRDRAAAKL
jgi:glycosyltransferase involved in cell wall biosynthesis